LRAMKASIDDDDLIVYVLNNLPKEYDMIVKQLEDDLHHTGDRKLTLERVRDKLRIKFQRIKKGHTDTADNEAALVAHNGGSQGGGGKFKGLCRVCGKYGLKGTDCWSNKSGKGGGKPSGGGSGAGDSGQGQGNNSSGGQKHKFKGKCFFCGYVGHRISECHKKKRQESGNVATVETAEVVLGAEVGHIDGAGSDAANTNAEIWICDSGASQHMTNNAEGMFDVVPVGCDIKIGDGQKLRALNEGKLKVTVVQLSGSKLELTLSKVLHVPGLCCSLFSVTQALGHGFTLTSTKDKTMKLQREKVAIQFDCRLATPNGFVLGARFSRLQTGTALVSTSGQYKKIDINVFHNQLGHPGEERLKATGEQLGLQLTGNLIPCEDCALGKARQKNVAKVNAHRSVTPGKRLYIDLSGIKVKVREEASFGLWLWTTRQE